jgi:integrase
MLWLSSGRVGVLSSDGIAETVARQSKIAGVTRPDGRLFTPHAARHFMADRAKRNGMSDDALSAQGGWTAGSSETARYGRGNKVERSHVAFQKLFGDA